MRRYLVIRGRHLIALTIACAFVFACAGCATVVCNLMGSEVDRHQQKLQPPGTPIKPGQQLIVKTVDGRKLQGSFLGYETRPDSVLLLRIGAPKAGELPGIAKDDTVAIPVLEVAALGHSVHHNQMAATVMGMSIDLLAIVVLIEIGEGLSGMN
jgi:hypothetical protein